MTIEEAFGIVIRRLRRERNFSQDKLSVASTLDRGFISNIEGGKQQPSLVSIFALASALNYSASSIMFETEFILNMNNKGKFRSAIENCRIDWSICTENIMMNIGECYKGTETILVADDEKQLRDLIAGLLDKCGYTTILAEDGQDAIEKYQRHDGVIHLVIMDVVMPRKDGISTYKEIKRIQPDAKIFFISGYHQDLIKSDDDFVLLQKPFSPMDMVKLIRKTLDGNPSFEVEGH